MRYISSNSNLTKSVLQNIFKSRCYPELSRACPHKPTCTAAPWPLPLLVHYCDCLLDPEPRIFSLLTSSRTPLTPLLYGRVFKLTTGARSCLLSSCVSFVLSPTFPTRPTPALLESIQINETVRDKVVLVSEDLQQEALPDRFQLRLGGEYL
jgi:hypothetical protein